METKLSDPQTRIYEFIVDYARQEGRPPTNREIGQAVGIRSTGHVDHHLSALERKGLITRVRGKSRGIRINEHQNSGLRLVGAIAAGAPLDIFPDTEQETFDMASDISGRAFVLVVKGDSMIEEHIESGDFVLVDPGVQNPSNGDIVVATHMSATTEGGAATLKRFYREQGHIRLQPANAKLKPFLIPANEWDNEWKVQGKVIAVYRRC